MAVGHNIIHSVNKGFSLNLAEKNSYSNFYEIFKTLKGIFKEELYWKLLLSILKQAQLLQVRQ